MKLFYLLTFAFIACTKETIDKPIVSKSVTYQRLTYGTSGHLVKVDTSIHWCRVSGEDLAKFEAEKRTNELICDTAVSMRLQLVIGDPCPLADTHYQNGKLKYYSKTY